MTTIKATVAGRRLELDVPADWPDGTEVEIHPLSSVALTENNMSPDEIARTLSLMDQIEPQEFSDSERADWDAKSQAQKDWEKSHFAAHAAKLQGQWE